MKKLMARAGAKLRSNRGESIAEVLVATLISAVALVLLASMISSSTRIIERSEHRLDAYYTENNALSAQNGTPSDDGTVTIRNTGTDTAPDVLLQPGKVSVNVKYYSNSESGTTDVVSYRYDPTT